MSRTLSFTNPRRLVVDSEQEHAAWSAYISATPLDASTRGEAPRPVRLEELSEVESVQLITSFNACYGTDFDVSPSALYEPTFAAQSPVHEEAAVFTTMSVEWWDVLEEDGTSCFQVWLYHADCGSVYTAGTDTVVAHIIQFHLTMPQDLTTWRALSDARRVAIASYPRSELARRAFDKTARCPKCRAFIKVAWPPEAVCPSCEARFPVPG